MAHLAHPSRVRLRLSRLILVAEAAGAGSSNPRLKSMFPIRLPASCSLLILRIVNISHSSHKTAILRLLQPHISKAAKPTPLQQARQQVLVPSLLRVEDIGAHPLDTIPEVIVRVLAAEVVEVGSRADTGDPAGAAQEPPQVSRTIRAQVVQLLRQPQILVITHPSRAMRGHKRRIIPSGPQRSCRLRISP